MSEPPEKRDSVVFLLVQRRYKPGSDLSVTFRRQPNFDPTTRDWVGLFRVGWTSTRDYYTFEWVPKPEADKLQDVVAFSGKRMPPEDSHFYHLVYVSRNGTVRGASAPFQFCAPATSIGPVDDLELVEVQDEGMSLMVLQHKGKGEIEQLRQDCQQTKDELESVQASVATMRGEKETLTAMIESKQTEIKQLEGKLAEAEATSVEIQREFGEEGEKWKRQEAQLRDQIAAVEAKLLEHEGQIRELEDNVQVARQAVDMERTKNKDLLATKSDEESQIQLLQNQIEALHIELVASTGELGDRTKEVKIKDAQIEDLQQLASAQAEEIEQLTAKLVEYQVDLQAKDTQLENIQSEKEIACEQLKQENAVQQENIIELTGANYLLSQELRQIKELPPIGPGSGEVVEKSIHDTLQQAYETMERYFLASDQENHNFRQKLQQSQDIVKTLEGQCDELLTRIEKGKNEFAAKAMECEKLKVHVKGVGGGEEGVQLQARLREMEETEKTLIEACEGAVRELTARKEEVKEHESRCAELEEELAQRQLAYNQLEERHDKRISEKNETLDQQQHVLDQKLEELMATRQAKEQLERQMEEHEKQTGDLEKEIGLVTGQLRETVTERDGLRVKVHQLKTQLQKVHTAARPEQPQRMCPVCETRFPARISQGDYEDHVQAHFME